MYSVFSSRGPIVGGLAATLLLLSTPALAGGGDDPPPLPLSEAERLVLSRNPALAAADANAAALAAVPPQVGALPDPQLSFKALNLPVDTFSTTQENMTQLQLGLAQALPFPGKLELKADAAAKMAQAARHHREELRLVLLRNTRIHWWNLAWLDKALAIVRHNQVLLRNLVRIADTRYKTGKGLQQDVLLAQLELSRLLERELKLKGARRREAAALNALLGRRADVPLRLPRSNVHDLEEMGRQRYQALESMRAHIRRLKRWARGHRPWLLALDARLRASDARLALARREYYPDFHIGAAYGLRRGINPVSRKARPDFTSLMLTMTLPVYTGQKQDKAVDQRTAEREQARLSWEDAVNQVDAEIESAASDLHIARDQVRLFDQGILPQARQTTASMLAGYQVGKVDFLNLVRAQLSEFNMEIQYWQQVTRAHQAEARLAAAAGKAQLFEAK